jgi:1,4-dihydroxy-2-naphthoate octaprenyltransferase
MIIFWFVLLFLWFLIIIFINISIPTVLWWFLFLLWVGLVVHWTISYRQWKKEDDLRRKTRKEYLGKG